MNELEKVIAQYQDKLNDVTSNYQQKIGGKTFDYDNDYDLIIILLRATINRKLVGRCFVYDPPHGPPTCSLQGY